MTKNMQLFEEPLFREREPYGAKAKTALSYEDIKKEIDNIFSGNVPQKDKNRLRQLMQYDDDCRQEAYISALEHCVEYFDSEKGDLLGWILGIVFKQKAFSDVKNTRKHTVIEKHEYTRLETLYKNRDLVTSEMLEELYKKVDRCIEHINKFNTIDRNKELCIEALRLFTLQEYTKAQVINHIQKKYRITYTPAARWFNMVYEVMVLVFG